MGRSEILVVLPDFPLTELSPPLLEVANSPKVVNLSKSTLIYRCPSHRQPATKGRFEENSFLSMREQNTIMFHADRCIKR